MNGVSPKLEVKKETNEEIIKRSDEKKEKLIAHCNEMSKSIPVDTKYSPEYTAGKIPYNLRAAYVAYLQAVQVSLVLKELDTFRCEQGEVRPEDHRLIIEARAKVDEFTERIARKLKLIT